MDTGIHQWQGGAHGAAHEAGSKDWDSTHFPRQPKASLTSTDCQEKYELPPYVEHPCKYPMSRLWLCSLAGLRFARGRCSTTFSQLSDARLAPHRTEPSVSLEDGPWPWIQSGWNTGSLFAKPTPLVPPFPQTLWVYLIWPEVEGRRWGCRAVLQGTDPHHCHSLLNA